MISCRVLSEGICTSSWCNLHHADRNFRAYSSEILYISPNLRSTSPLFATEIKLRAEWKAGEFLAEMKEAGELDKGGRPSKTTDNMSAVSPTLAELGIAQQESSR